MEQYISKSALVAEIKKRAIEAGLHDGVIAETREDECYSILSFLDTLEVKEVDLEEYYHDFLQKEWFGKNYNRTMSEMMAFTAKHFFELGLNASNPIAEMNLESLVRQINDLSLEAGKHYDSVIKEERKKYGGSDLAINLLNGTIDAKELCIQYVLDKLKAKKGEKI